MHLTPSGSRKIAWGPWSVVAVGSLLFLLGVRRFVARHRFGFVDLLYCCLAVLAAGFLLLVFDYFIHHAKLVLVIPLALVTLLAVSSPAFDVGLGLALVASIAGPALNDWKYEKRRRQKSTVEQLGENEERQS